jgi:drug/metabolite transporter (DMT)-like permease
MRWSRRWDRYFCILLGFLYTSSILPILFSMWYLALFFSVLAISGVNIIDKVLSTSTDRSLALLYRYSASIIVLFGASIIFQVSYITWVYAAICIWLWVLNYLINIIMYRGLERIHTWVFFVIGYLYLVFLFFINIHLFGESEILGWSKIVLGAGFVSVIFAIMYLWGVGSRHGSRLGYVFALICALGWTFSFAISAYLIKTVGIHPIATLLYEIIGSCLFWLIMFYRDRAQFPGKVYTKKEAIAPLLGGSLLAIWLVLFFVSYWYFPANIVNIVSLSDLLVTTFFGYYFLHEKIEKKILMLGFIAFVLLIGFNIV